MARQGTSAGWLIRPRCDLDWQSGSGERRGHSTDAARCGDLGVEAGLSSSAPTVATASESRFPSRDVRARVAAIELLLREGLGGPAQAEEPPTPPRIPDTKAEIEALGWEEPKALALPTPRRSACPRRKRKPWSYERWVGLTQAGRDAFRAALDAADAPPHRVHGRLATPR